jgi:hypothetical protein
MNWDRAYGIEVGGVRESGSDLVLDDCNPTGYGVFLRHPLKGLSLVDTYASEAEAVIAAANLQKIERIPLTNRVALVRFFAREHKSSGSYTRENPQSPEEPWATPIPC